MFNLRPLSKKKYRANLNKLRLQTNDIYMTLQEIGSFRPLNDEEKAVQNCLFQLDKWLRDTNLALYKNKVVNWSEEDDF